MPHTCHLDPQAENLKESQASFPDNAAWWIMLVRFFRNSFRQFKFTPDLEDPWWGINIKIANICNINLQYIKSFCLKHQRALRTVVILLAPIHGKYREFMLSKFYIRHKWHFRKVKLRILIYTHILYFYSRSSKRHSNDKNVARPSSKLEIAPVCMLST